MPEESTDIASLIHKAIDSGATSVEEVHQKIAAMPLDAIIGPDSVKEAAAGVKDAQAKTIGSVYELIHSVNQKVQEMAPNILGSSGSSI